MNVKYMSKLKNFTDKNNRMTLKTNINNKMTISNKVVVQLKATKN